MNLLMQQCAIFYDTVDEDPDVVLDVGLNLLFLSMPWNDDAQSMVIMVAYKLQLLLTRACKKYHSTCTCLAVCSRWLPTGLTRCHDLHA